VQLDFDVQALQGSALGILLRPGPTRSWNGVLAVLVDLGLCAPKSRSAVLAWPGASIETLPDNLWPVVFDRYVSHVKLACTTANDPRAKVYFGVQPRWPRFAGASPGAPTATTNRAQPNASG
jgi:hypothetical protein